MQQTAETFTAAAAAAKLHHYNHHRHYDNRVNIVYITTHDTDMRISQLYGPKGRATLPVIVDNDNRQSTSTKSVTSVVDTHNTWDDMSADRNINLTITTDDNNKHKHYLGQRRDVMFYWAFVCLSVCLSVCRLAPSCETTKQIFVKIFYL